MDTHRIGIPGCYWSVRLHSADVPSVRVPNRSYSGRGSGENPTTLHEARTLPLVPLTPSSYHPNHSSCPEIPSPFLSIFVWFCVALFSEKIKNPVAFGAQTARFDFRLFARG